jgi:hypothetical protein
MMRQFKILIPLFLLCWLAYLIFGETRQADPASGRHRVVDATSSEHEAETQQQASFNLYQQEVQAQAEALRKMADEKARRDEAGLKTREVRAQLQAAVQAAWETVLRTNSAAFLALKEKAALSPNKSVPCSICDAKGVLHFCILCGHSGKCVECKGTGRLLNGDCCPACLGSGRCHVCFGSGKMPCPFCQSLKLTEIVTPESPAPPALMPLY